MSIGIQQGSATSFFSHSVCVCMSKNQQLSYLTPTSRGCVCEIGFSLLFDTLSSAQFAFTLISLRAILNLFKYEICVVCKVSDSHSIQFKLNSIQNEPCFMYLCVFFPATTY